MMVYVETKKRRGSPTRPLKETPPDLPFRGGDLFAKVKLRVYETAVNGFEKVKTKVCKEENKGLQNGKR